MHFIFYNNFDIIKQVLALVGFAIHQEYDNERNRLWVNLM